MPPKRKISEATEISHFQTIMRNLLLQGKYSDLTISCGGCSFRVHRAIICPQSQFFEAAANGNFMEAHSNLIVLPEEHPETIERVLSFLYIQDYEQREHTVDLSIETVAGDSKEEFGSKILSCIHDIEAPVSGGGDSGFENAQINEPIAYNNLRVYVAAEKFGIWPLKQLAKERLIAWAKEFWGCQSFPEIVREILSSVPAHDSDLTDCVIELIVKNAKDIMEQENMVRVMEDFGTLTTAVLKGVVGEKALLESQLRHSEAEVNRLTGMAKESNWGKLTSQMNNLRKCRHCEVDFNLRAEGGSYGWGTLRCGRCNTRH